MKRVLAAVALLALTQSAGAVVIDTSKCVVIFNDADRLKCFDDAVKQSIENGPPAASANPASAPARPATVTTQAAADEFKLVDPNDVRNTPEKWQGRKIQFNNVRVYWVADNDVRIITNTSLTLFARAVLAAGGHRSLQGQLRNRSGIEHGEMSGQRAIQL